MTIRAAIRCHVRSGMARRILIVALSTLSFSSLPCSLMTRSACADEVSNLVNSHQLENLDQAEDPDSNLRGTQESNCLKSVPTPSPAHGLHRVVQLVNCATGVTLLGAANAAQQKGGNPQPILSKEGRWELGPQGGGNNVLTFEIPLNWENTKCPADAHGMCLGIVGPRFWARTGCRVDIDFDKAQCETGGCGGRYDCSAARQSSSVGTTVSEWTFAEPVDNSPATPPVSYLKDSPDISAVDGANLNMDIEPVGGSPHDPFDVNGPGKAPHDIQWLAEQSPLTMQGQDVRADCNVSDFQLLRSTLATSNPYGFVILNANKQVVGGDYTVSCFSNCGRYAFPQPPQIICDPSDKTSVCYFWKSFCLGDPSQYGPTHPCNTDNDCPVNGACWIIDNSHTGIDHTCQGRAFVKNQNCFPNADGTANPNCPYVTYQYGYTDNTITPPQTFKSTQPPLGRCIDVSSDPNSCIGDDTLHKVMPKVYTWPNDPQVYGGDASLYRVIIAPGGIPPSAPKITDESQIPLCSSSALDETEYNKAQAFINCANNINYGALFAVAHRIDQIPNPNWGCDLDPTGSGDEGPICKWTQPETAKITQVGFRANFNSAGTNLQLNVIPTANDEQSRGGVKVGDLLLASITFSQDAGMPKVPDGWTPVPKASVSNSNDQTIVWYHFAAVTDLSSYTWTWNSPAFPAGGITVWRGVNSSNPFDVPAATGSGTGQFATAPALTPASENIRLLSVFGAGNQSNQAFQQPVGVGPGIGGDETMAVKVIGGPANRTWFAHLVGDRIQVTKSGNPTAAQQVQIIPNPNPPGGPAATWTAISIALRPQSALAALPRP